MVVQVRPDGWRARCSRHGEVDSADLEVLPASEALKSVAAFRLALPRAMLRFAGGREITLGDLGARQGILGGINAVIVGNYLTTLGRSAEADLELLEDLQMPIKALNASL
jgi:biotin synthase